MWKSSPSMFIFEKETSSKIRFCLSFFVFILIQIYCYLDRTVVCIYFIPEFTLISFCHTVLWWLWCPVLYNLIMCINVYVIFSCIFICLHLERENRLLASAYCQQYKLWRWTMCVGFVFDWLIDWLKTFKAHKSILSNAHDAWPMSWPVLRRCHILR
jgi:hypothetical protein